MREHDGALLRHSGFSLVVVSQSIIFQIFSDVSKESIPNFISRSFYLVIETRRCNIIQVAVALLPKCSRLIKSSVDILNCVRCSSWIDAARCDMSVVEVSTHFCAQLPRSSWWRKRRHHPRRVQKPTELWLSRPLCLCGAYQSWSSWLSCFRWQPASDLAFTLRSRRGAAADGGRQSSSVFFVFVILPQASASERSHVAYELWNVVIIFRLKTPWRFTVKIVT